MPTARWVLLPAVAVGALVWLFATSTVDLPTWVQAGIAALVAVVVGHAARPRPARGSREPSAADAAIRAKAYRDTLVLAALLWLTTIAAPGLDPKVLTFVFLVLALLDYVVRKAWNGQGEQGAAQVPVATGGRE